MTGPADGTDPGTASTGDAAAAPALRIVRGAPDDHEVAALTAVLAALSGRGGEAVPEQVRRAWNDPARRVRSPLPHGPGAWRRAARSS